MAKIPTEFDARRLPDIIRRPLVNEKATRMLELNKYTFEVVKNATKPEVKAAIESLFSVKVMKVNTHLLPAATRRVGKFAGKRSQYKRAIVTLAPNDKIDLFPDV
ncbi:50S ribosomal protein L23 [Tumidithrix elongata RA019]|uniref:Large ribosomal subunit protein uL23 n=1 Tax=Tumidithrix elongata BACA0141 TaxID=2716417 RepID=A0AAW9Q080_9CYAN|nr:50S ribosomal protein L23 [Tumidithrix elongata RA019]